MIQTATNPLAGNQGADKTSGGRTPSLTNAALNLAAAGWPVFPCRHTGPTAKAPMTKNGHLNATTDPDKIKTWWQKWPHAMIGAAIPQSLLVIDIDPRNGGSIEALTELVGVLPDTLTAWSGRNDDGRHLYFLRPPGPLSSTRLPEGIDLKVNGYCIVPPSIHPATGQPYLWEDHPFVPLAYRLRELLRPVPAPVRTHPSSNSKAAGVWCAQSPPPLRASETASCTGLRAEPPRKVSSIKSPTCSLPLLSQTV